MIKIKNLEKLYDKVPILKNVQLEIEAGTLFALVGPNGSGKTTLLKCISKLVYPDSGSIEMDGKNIHEISMRAGYMPQIPQFPKNLKTSELIDFFVSIDPIKPIYKEQLIEDLQIQPFMNKYFHQLSGGMKQKLNILQCFMSKRPLYIIDEPTASLDPSITFYLKNLMKSKKIEGSSIIFTSHIMSEVEELADQMALLIEGNLILVDSPSQIMSKQNSPNLEHALRNQWKLAGNS